MKSKQYEILLDIYKGVLNQQSITFVTEDNGRCILNFQILHDKITPYDLTNCIVRMVIAGRQQDCIITNAATGKVSINLLQGMFSVAGNYRAELQIYDTENQTLRLTTPTFLYSVRSSLMNDSTVAADFDYSILQNMIINVSNADKTATQALGTAGKAIERMNTELIPSVEKAITDTNAAITAANTASENANAKATYAKEKGDYAKSIADGVDARLGDIETKNTEQDQALAEKITLNGESQTNFNFIANEVVKDGLVSVIKNETLNRVSKTISIQPTYDFDILMTFKMDKIINTRIISFGDFAIAIGAGGIYIYNLTPAPSIPCNATNATTIRVIKEKDIISLLYDGKVITRKLSSNYVTSNIVLNTGVNSEVMDIYQCLVYNRPLTPQEIQHNFNVLNNSPSINQLNVDGKSYVLSTDTSHTTENGISQEEINRGFYRRNCKSFSSDGSDIVVENCEVPSYVLEGEIKGNTVKNCIDISSRDCLSTPHSTLSFTNDKYLRFQGVSDSIGAIILKDKCSVDANKTYTLFLFCKNNTLTPSSGTFRFNNSTTTYFNESFPHTSVSNLNGIVKVKLTTKPNLSDVTSALNMSIRNDVVGGSVEIKAVLLEGDYTNTDIPLINPIPFGLNSTEASISCGGVKQVFYASEEDKEAKKPILLSKFMDVADKLELKDDVSLVVVEDVKQVVLNGSENWKEVVCDKRRIFDLTDFLVYDSPAGNYNENSCICDKYNGKYGMLHLIQNDGSEFDNCICVAGKNIRISASLSDTRTLEEFKRDLNTTLIYKLATPTTTHIPKSVNDTVLISDKRSIFAFGGAVKPSAASVSLPVDKMGEMQTEIELIKQQLGAVASLQLKQI